MVKGRRYKALVGLLALIAAAVGGAAAAQAPLGTPGAVMTVTAGTAATPDELRAWDARLDAMILTGELVVTSRRADRTRPGRTHEYAAQVAGGVPVHGAGVSRQFVDGVTVSAFGTLHEHVVVDTVPGITAGEAAAQLARQTGAALTDGRRPALVVLPLPGGSYVLAYRATLANGRHYFASAADGQIVQARDAFWTQSAIGTGLGILGNRKKVMTLLQGGRFEAHDQLRPGEIVTLDAMFDEGRLDRLLAPGPEDIRRWTAQDIAADGDNDWADPAVVDGHVHMGWTYDYFARQHGWEGLDGRRGRIIGVVNNAFHNAFAAPPPFGPEGLGVYAFGEYRGPNAPDGEPLVSLHVVAHELMHGVTFHAVSQRTGSPFGLLDAFIEGVSVRRGPERFTDQAGVTHTCRTATFPILDFRDDLWKDVPAYCSADGHFWLAALQGSAVNEALSDIFGVSAGFFHAAAGATASYDVGVDGADGALRSLRDPRSPFNPRAFDDRIEFPMACLKYIDGDCYFDFAGVVFIGGEYVATIDDCCYGGEHLNSTILSHAFYLAIEGGTNRATGRAVAGVGAANRAVIEAIFFRGLTELMPVETTLPGTAAVLRQAAADLQGRDSAPYRAVDQALRAAGL